MGVIAIVEEAHDGGGAAFHVTDFGGLSGATASGTIIDQSATQTRRSQGPVF
jgi:hypothetical protein